MGLMQKFKREIRSAVGKQLAFDIRNGYGAALSGLFERIGRGQKVYDSEIREMMTGRAEADDEEGKAERVRLAAGPTIVPGAKTGKFTALVSLHGVAMYDSEYQPYCFSTLLLSQIMGRLAADPQIEKIVLDIDTPGGMVTGTQEAADAVWAARKKKPVIGLVNPLCASAGYWIASQCTEIIGVPSADIGSIGVFMCHYDCSAMLADAGIKPTYIFAGEYKTEGNSSEPLSDDGKAWFQSEVDGTYSDFIAAVARGRGVTSQAVIDKFGKGRCFSALMAKKVGMIDSISTIQGALASWGVPDLAQEANRRRSDAEDAPEPVVAEVDEPERQDAEVFPAFVSAEGCEACSFTQVMTPGAITIYVAQPWPAKLLISETLLDGSQPVNIVGVVGDKITFAVANGAAVYTKLGHTENREWICTLEPDSSFTPPPAAASAAAEQADALEAIATADVARKAEAESIRHRLAILAA